MNRKICEPLRTRRENVVSVDAILFNNASGDVSEEEVKDFVNEEQQEEMRHGLKTSPSSPSPP